MDKQTEQEFVIEDIAKAYDSFFEKRSNKSISRLHISNSLFSIDDFEENEQNVSTKPTGLWYAANDSWVDWCKSEMPHWLKPYIYEVVVYPDHIYSIKNASEFVEFEKTYRKIEHHLYPKSLAPILDRWYVNYPLLAEKYGGLEIIPYLWEFRLQSMWYYGWDCASGCVFKKSAIKDIRFLAQFDASTKEFVYI